METYRNLNDYEIMYMVEENEEAKDLLFDKYRPIVINIAKGYLLNGKKLGLELDDLVQEGYLGLYSAFKNYNPDQNTLFYTYALISIRSKILNCIKKNSTYKHKSLNQSLSLSQPISGNQDSTFIDFVVDERSIFPELVVEETEFIDSFNSFLFSLDIESASVFELNMNGFSNADIGKLLDCPLKFVANTIFKVRKKIDKCLY